MSTGYKVVAMIWFGLFLSRWSQAQQLEETVQTLSPADFKVIKWQELSYPSLARNTQGVVVVRIKLNKSGGVADAEALSGNDIFIADALKNVKMWKFESNTSRRAVVVYNFRIVQGRCKSPSSFFTFDEPNIATITACLPESSSPVIGNTEAFRNTQAMISDKEMEVLDFEDMEFLIIENRSRSSGVVVVQAKLNDRGNVIDAFPIFGRRAPIPECLANVKKWQFRPNSKQMAVVVYRFTFPSDQTGRVVEKSQFVLDPPNFVTITGTGMEVTW